MLRKPDGVRTYSARSSAEFVQTVMSRFLGVLAFVLAFLAPTNGECELWSNYVASVCWWCFPLSSGRIQRSAVRLERLGCEGVDEQGVSNEIIPRYLAIFI